MKITESVLDIFNSRCLLVFQANISLFSHLYSLKAITCVYELTIAFVRHLCSFILPLFLCRSP